MSDPWTEDGLCSVCGTYFREDGHDAVAHLQDEAQQASAHAVEMNEENDRLRAALAQARAERDEANAALASKHESYKYLYALWCRVARAVTPPGGPDITDEEVADRAEWLEAKVRSLEARHTDETLRQKAADLQTSKVRIVEELNAARARCEALEGALEAVAKVVESEPEYPTPWPPEKEKEWAENGVTYQVAAQAAVAETKRRLAARIRALSPPREEKGAASETAHRCARCGHGWSRDSNNASEDAHHDQFGTSLEACPDTLPEAQDE